MIFEHYLLTRVNIGLYDRKQKVRGGQKIEPQSWMEHRLDLFEKYCAPSVNNQRCQNFTWFIVLDPKTPMEHRMRIENAVQVKHKVLFGDNFRKAVKKEIPIQEIVITSRMDCDDAIHMDFIKDIQEWYEKKKKTGVVTFPKGWTYNIKKENLCHFRYPKNPFLTLIEKADKKVRTILFHRHTEAIKFYKLHKVETGHRWCMVVHDQNLSNRMWGDSVPVSSLSQGEWW